MTVPMIGGIPLYEYRIVLPADAGDGERYAASDLSRFARETTGDPLPVVTDAEPQIGCELLLGGTNRTASADAAPGAREAVVSVGCRFVTVTAGCAGALLAGADALIDALAQGDVPEGFTLRTGEVPVPYRGSEVYQNCEFGKKLAALRLTGDVRRDILAIAYSQLGYSEGNFPGDFAGTGGSNKDITEFGRWYGKQGMWCQMFASFCVYHAGVPTSVFRKTSWTVKALTPLIERGRAYSRAEVEAGAYTPQPADIIYYKSKRNDYITNHVGIVTRYENGTVYTIEGNARALGETVHHGRVVEKHYEITDPYIVYIACPEY